MRIKHITYSIAAAAILLSDNIHAQGLRFTGLEDNIESRTSLNVFNDTKVKFKTEMEISFSVSMLPKSRFGYILRIKDLNDPSRIWNLLYNGRGPNTVIQLNEEGRYCLIKAELPCNVMRLRHITDIRLRFDMAKDSVYLNIDNLKYCGTIKDFPTPLVPSIEFGLSDHIIDVPSFELRNLEIRGAKNEYIFPMTELDGNDLHNDKGFSVGRVTNPTWLMDESIKWKKIHSAHFKQHAGVNYLNERKKILYFSDDSLYVYNMTDGTHRHRILRNEDGFKVNKGMSLFKDEVLYAYELCSPGKYSCATMQLKDGKWVPLSTGKLSSPQHHHCSFYNKFTDEFVVYGGFGEEQYNGTFYAMDSEGHWKEIWNGQHDSLFHRYFTSAGLSPDGMYVYIFGGMGNECGEQAVGRRYYYDLHRIDLQTGECTKLWDIKWNSADITPVRNIIVEDQSFYALCYPEYLSKSQLNLYRFSLKDGSYEILGAPVPIVSDRILTNANLYYDKELAKLIATVQEFDNDVRSSLNVYTLSYPPRSAADSYFAKPTIKTIITLCCIMTLLATAVWILCYSFRKKRLQQTREIVISKKANPNKRIYKSRIRNNSINIFGEFAVYDKNGNDISSLFSAQQRTILYLAIQNNGKHGLSSRKLSNTLWPDKDEDKVKNSRGVAINHLRRTLSELSGISLTFDGGYYKLITGQEFWCDYFLFKDEISKPHPESCIILEIASRGKFMKCVGNPVFDNFKEDTETELINFLYKEMEEMVRNGRNLEVIEIADMIFEIDPLDETAIRECVRALVKLHLKDEALARYASFASEYRKLNEENYISFKNLL